MNVFTGLCLVPLLVVEWPVWREPPIAKALLALLVLYFSLNFSELQCSCKALKLASNIQLWRAFFSQMPRYIYQSYFVTRVLKALYI